MEVIPKNFDGKFFFDYKNDHTLVVDFKTKHKHQGCTVLETTYKNKRNELQWSDGNVWRRIRLDPSIVLDYYEKH